MRPPYLKEGSVIGITCPASYVSHERTAYAIVTLEKWGFKVKRGKTIGTEHFYFSGTDDERLADLQDMMDDPGIDAILMGRGGYGMSRIIDRIDFAGFLKHPKWICGFSDFTLLHNHLQRNHNYASLHSPMCIAFRPETENADHIAAFRDALLGNAMKYSIPPSPYNRAGKAQGILTGGNLAMIDHIMGSVSEVNTDGKILFIEDIGEYLYRIDRMMLTLKRAGKLDNLAALVVGSFTDMEDTERPFGQTVEEIIADKVKEYSYPVCFGFPTGHQEVNYTLTMGEVHSLGVSRGGSVLELVK